MQLPYQQYFSAMPCYLTVQDRNFRVITANRRFVQAFGDFLGRCCYQVYKRRPEKCEVCPVEKTFRDGQSYSSEEQVTCLDGREVSVIVYTEPIRDESGQITSVMELSTDITDIKRLQNQLRDSQMRYQTLFEEVPCYISIQDRDLRIVDANRQHCEAFGTFLGCKCYEVYKHRSEECHPCIVRQTFADGQLRVHEEVVTSRSGKSINVLVHTSPIFNSSGEIEHVIEMSADITQIRELQSQLTSTGLLISSISHGIKGLLNALNGGIYLVNAGLKKDNRARLEQGWEIVLRSIDRIRSMVLDILYYAKDREPDWQSVKSSQLLEEVHEVLSGRAGELGIKLIKQVETGDDTLDADPKALRAMLVNLVENSLDACRVDKKKESHQVTMRLKPQPEDIAFEIEDDGIGMEQETREKAFSLFFSSKGHEGTGLGLFVAGKIVQAHGGTIVLDSSPDLGTNFTVRIPRRRKITN
ncbi:MAG: PAS domain-containing protein [Calditrichota bacterium]